MKKRVLPNLISECNGANIYTPMQLDEFSKAATKLTGVLKGACWRDCAFDMVKKTGGANNSGIDKLADRDQFNSLMGHLYGDSS